jgi:hypothetical protein
MDLYVYQTDSGQVADFRAYLDGHDHAFDDHRALAAGDPRWEKIHSLRHPVQLQPLSGVRLIGRANTKWRELMQFPIAWSGDFEPFDWQ